MVCHNYGCESLRTMIPVIYRICVGPTGFDRILGKCHRYQNGSPARHHWYFYDRVEMFVDFALTYALLNFVAAIIVSRYLNRTISLKDMEAREKAKGEGKA